MNWDCEQFQQAMSEEVEPIDAPEWKQALSTHIETCNECQLIYEQWQFIRDEIRLFAEENTMDHKEPSESSRPTSMSTRVMEEIYRHDNWRRPVAERKIQLPDRAFKKASLAVASFMAVFLVGFLYSLLSPAMVPVEETLIGLQPIAASTGEDAEWMSTTAMASITVPMKLTPDVTLNNVNYLLVISLVGIVCLVLIMNWFTRARAK